MNGAGSNAARGQAMMRAADAMLRVIGATDVYLRLPTAAAAEATAVELGLAAPLVEDVVLSPVVVTALAGDARQQRLRYELLMSAAAVARVMESRGLESAETLFRSALGILLNGQLLHVEALAVEMFAGMTSLYRVTVTE
jgi:hypothetical protein